MAATRRTLVLLVWLAAFTEPRSGTCAAAYARHAKCLYVYTIPRVAPLQRLRNKMLSAAREDADIGTRIDMEDETLPIDASESRLSKWRASTFMRTADSLFSDIWYNCDRLTQQCLGNALQDESYRRGLLTIAVLTLIFSSNSPALHSLYTIVADPPPVYLLNAAAGVCAAMGMIFGGDFLASLAGVRASKSETVTSKPTNSNVALLPGMELGVWKTLGATCNLWGLAATSASHGAFLIQLTTLIVPLAQGLTGTPVPRQIYAGMAMALVGLGLFTNDPTAASSSSFVGDLYCILAACFYATYDLRLFHYGKRLPPVLTSSLIRYKVVTQAGLGLAFLAVNSLTEASQSRPSNLVEFFTRVTPLELAFITCVTLWSGLVVNAGASVFQVGAQQAVGASRAQILYATGPLWSSLMSMALLGESFGSNSLLGGAVFLAAMLVAATAPPPQNVCNDDQCEV